MPPKKHKKNIQYSSENMKLAITAVKSKAMSKSKAAITYGVPRTTLNDKISERYRPGKCVGRDPFLSEAEERDIVQ